jgi:hypothetical protein
MRDVPFVDMVVEGRDLDIGAIDGLEAIYAHELGHLVMAALAGPAPRKASSSMHFITVRTDPWYAFTEGFGEHFQPVALDHYAARVPGARRNPPPSARETFWRSRLERELAEGCWICPANLRFLWWHGRAEQRLRDAPLRDNLFVHGVVLPDPLQREGRPAAEARMYRDATPPTAYAPLKNASQMLSSEGVIASLFYRLASDARLRSSYREPAFYRAFLSGGEAALLDRLSLEEIVTPAENVYLKAFDVMHAGFEWDDAPALSLVSAWAARFPEDAPALYEVFLDVTRGVTVEQEAAFAHKVPGYLAGLRDRLLAGSARLDGNLGKPLWIFSPGMTLGMGLYRYVPIPQSFTFDLNAADAADLRAVSGVSALLASAILRAREARGAFGAVADLASVPGMTPEVLERFTAGFSRMEERFGRARERANERQASPTWMMNYLVVMVRGAYYVAAAWQFLRAAVVAGLAYLLVMWIGRKLRGPRAYVPVGVPSAGGAVPLCMGRRTPAGPAVATAAARARGRGPFRRAIAASGRGIAVLARGAAVASLPLAVSMFLYSRGVFPTPANMAAAGLAVAALARGAASLRGSDSPQATAVALTRAVALVVASAVVGAMY